MTITADDIRAALATVAGPDGKGDIVSLGMVSDPFVTTRDGQAKVMFSLTVPAERAQELENLRAKAQVVVENINGVSSAMVALTAERKFGAGAASGGGMAPPPPPPMMPTAKIGKPEAAAQTTPPKPAQPGIPGVKHIIAVASGKGGVGKSTTSVNLALGLRNRGLSVGILDADIYGPSLPRLLGLTGKPEAEGRILKPMQAMGLKAMSIGFLVAEDSPMIWRGPMVISALTQLMREVEWAPLDVLIVDMPPGTGDAQLTMAQQVPLAGAVIVSTPQDLALIDARKGLNMFNKVSVPILGIVENMSTFICPKCGEQTDIFGHGGAKAEAEKLGVPFLGAVPLHLDIRTNSDGGTPVVDSAPDGPHAAIYNAIAEKVHASLDNAKSEGPAIVFD
ncbi:P-loop NTPase [Pseudahrensia aquimaris]|uniref:Iron-sulfur cluster carrier protein n=1 Tax=Pseudahrensia aquimaris TaxID=744461 RepID=A0ABW3FE89_9HYPH